MRKRGTQEQRLAGSPRGLPSTRHRGKPESSTKPALSSTGPFQTYTPVREEPNATKESPTTPERDTEAPLAFGTISQPTKTDTLITNNLPANEGHRTNYGDVDSPPAPSPLRSWHQDHEVQHEEQLQGEGTPFYKYINPMRRRMMETGAQPLPEPYRPPPPATRSGANDVRCHKNGLMSRHRHTLKNKPATDSNTNPLGTRGSTFPDWEDLDRLQRETLFDLIHKLEQEHVELKQDKSLSQERSTILLQETDPLRAHLYHWASHGPSGLDIPQDIPLTCSQVHVLNQRVRMELAHRGLPIITPIPLPPLPGTNLPPLRSHRLEDTSYRRITGTYDKHPPTTGTFDKPGAPERSDWTPPLQAPGPRNHQRLTPKTGTIGYPPSHIKKTPPSSEGT